MWIPDIFNRRDTPASFRRDPSKAGLPEWVVPALLLALCGLSYGALIRSLGFYWDDWPGIWVAESLGGDGLRAYMAVSRPLEGTVLSLGAAALGVTPLNWHIFALLTRWASAVLVYWTVRGIWPDRVRQAACIASVFAVYPGFAVQPIAWIHSQGYFIALVLVMLSLGAMVWALRVPQLSRLLTTAAIVSCGTSMMLIEHFVGLELLRPVLLWFALENDRADWRTRLRCVIKAWLPYAAVVAAFVFWRLAVFNPPVEFLDQSAYFSAFAANPVAAIRVRLRKALSDLIVTTQIAWARTLTPEMFDFDAPGVWLALALTVLAAALLIIILLQLRSRADGNDQGADGNEQGDSAPGLQWGRRATVIGLLAICLGGLPVWFANRHVNLDVNSDANRYSLGMMFGASLLAVGVVRLLIATDTKRIVIIGALCGLAVGFHVRNAQRFATDWTNQQALYWQLSWRVPGVKPGTSLLIETPASVFAVDYALAAPMNFLYDRGHRDARLNYWAFNLSRDLLEKIPRFTDDMPLRRVLFSLSFEGSTSDSIVAWFSPPSCLRVLDPARDDVPQLSGLSRTARRISHLGQIEANPAVPARPPTNIFGAEPVPNWCYFYEKADLARQRDDWRTVAELGDRVRQLGYRPQDPTEWLLFVEGYVEAGRHSDAAATAGLALAAVDRPAGSTDPDASPQQMALQMLVRPALCDLMQRLETNGMNVDGKIVVGELARVSCDGGGPTDDVLPVLRRLSRGE